MTSHRLDLAEIHLIEGRFWKGDRMGASVGPRRVPWGTPDRTGDHWDPEPFTRPRCLLPGLELSCDAVILSLEQEPFVRDCFERLRESRKITSTWPCSLLLPAFFSFFWSQILSRKPSQTFVLPWLVISDIPTSLLPRKGQFSALRMPKESCSFDNVQWITLLSPIVHALQQCLKRNTPSAPRSPRLFWILLLLTNRMLSLGRLLLRLLLRPKQILMHHFVSVVAFNLCFSLYWTKRKRQVTDRLTLYLVCIKWKQSSNSQFHHYQALSPDLVTW